MSHDLIGGLIVSGHVQVAGRPNREGRPTDKADKVVRLPAGYDSIHDTVLGREPPFPFPEGQLPNVHDLKIVGPVEAGQCTVHAEVRQCLDARGPVAVIHCIDSLAPGVVNRQSQALCEASLELCL